MTRFVRYHAKVELAPFPGDSIVVTTPDLDRPGPKIVYVNDVFVDTFGYQPADVLGATPRMFQGPRTDPAVLRHLRQCLTQNTVFEGETINYRRNGEGFLLRWTVSALTDSQGRITHYLARQRDVERDRRVFDAAPGREGGEGSGTAVTVPGAPKDPRWNAEVRKRVASRLRKYDLEPEEQEVVELICAGANVRTISDELVLPGAAVRRELASACRRLGVRNERDLLAKLLMDVLAERD